MGLAACYPSPISYHAQRRVPFLHRIGGNYSSPSLLLGDNFEMDSNGSESRVTSSKSRAERKKRAAGRKKRSSFFPLRRDDTVFGLPPKKEPELNVGQSRSFEILQDGKRGPRRSANETLTRPQSETNYTDSHLRAIKA